MVKMFFKVFFAGIKNIGNDFSKKGLNIFEIGYKQRVKRRIKKTGPKINKPRAFKFKIYSLSNKIKFCSGSRASKLGGFTEQEMAVLFIVAVGLVVISCHGQ